MPVTRSKRKASEKQPIETQGDLPSSHKAPRSRRSQKTPNAPVPEEIGQKGAALTRRRAQALGEQPTSARDEPERYLQQQARQQARTASKNDAEEMERRQSGGPPRGGGDDDDGRQNALQGLLRRLGAGFEDAFPGMGMMGGGGGARIKTIVAMLREEDEENHLAGLTELCECLAVATEETMVSFPIDQTVPLLVGFLAHKHNPDVMLLAARALTNLADVFPPACSYIIRHNAVPAFCARLLTIEYIDLAEQSLQALEKLSHEHPGSLLRAGALVAVLSYVDFFQTGVQRVAVATAANICRGLTTSSEYVDAVSTAAPILINLLSYSDVKIVDSACLALTRIAEAYSRSPEHLERLVGYGLINSIVEMLAVNESGSITSQLSTSTFYGLVKLLATCAAGSHVVAESLLDAGISGTIKNLLTTSPLLSATTASPGNALRSAEQLQDLVSLASQLLPAIPYASTAALTPPMETSLNEETRNGHEEAAAVGGAGAVPSTSSRRSGLSVQASALAEYVNDNPSAVVHVAEDLTAVMLQVHASSGTSLLKRKVRNVLAKILSHTPVPTLSTVLLKLPISSLVARLLRSEDSAVVAEGMQMAEMLMEKLPQQYSKFFLKEGVVAAMEELAAAAPPLAPSSAAAVDTTAAAVASGSGAAAATTTTTGVKTRRSSRSTAAAEEKAPSAPQVKKEEETVVVAANRPGQEGRNATAATATTAVGERPPLSSGTTTTLRNALATQARRFFVRYFTDQQGNSIGCRTEGVIALEQICNRLPDPTAVQDLLTALAATEDAAISTFELSTSGTVRKLRAYLQGEDLSENNNGIVDNGDDAAEARRWRLLERLGQFSEIALPPGSGGAPPLVALVEQLQSALTAAERFEVQSTDISSISSGYSFFGGGGGYFGGGGGGRGGMSRSGDGASGSLSAGLAALSNPFKIKLARYSGEQMVADYSSNVVLIEPLASMNQVEEFLWRRVVMSPGEQQQMNDREQGTGGGGGGFPRGRGGAAAAALPATTTTTAAAAATAGGNGGNGARAASRSRPIPQPAGKRMTRAQARAAAEAEVAAQGEEAAGDGVDAGVDDDGEQDMDVGEEMPIVGATAATGGGGIGGSSGGDEPDSVGEDEFGEDDEDDEDLDMEEDGYVEGDEDYDDDEDMMLDAAAMEVHDMHLADEPAATTTASALERPASSLLPEAPAAAAAAAAYGGSPRGGGGNGGAGTRGGRSYAGAAAAGAAAAARDGTAGAGVPRLAFYYNGRLIDPGMTIFQAVRSFSASSLSHAGGGGGGGGSGRDLGSRLWGQVHTLTYRSYEAAIRERDEATAAAAAATEKTTKAGKGLGGGAGSFLSTLGGLLSSPLAELLSPASVFTPPPPQPSQTTTTPRSKTTRRAVAPPQPPPPPSTAATELAGASPDCLDVLIILSLLEAINRLANHLHVALEGRKGKIISPSAVSPGHVSRETFINGRLAPKLAQQLKDVVSICGGSLPPWCDALPRHARYLFPFDVRRRLFYCTSFGLSRALFYLQQSHTAEHGPGNASDRDTGSLRISRVQRQKVRLARTRILESAHRVFELYAGAKSQLEVEFFGEVGSGLGPTLEFYTLLSHEMQRRSLGLWRDEGADAATAADEKEKLPAAAVVAVDVAAAVMGGLSGLGLSPNNGINNRNINNGTSVMARMVSGPGPLRGELITADDRAAALALDSSGGGTGVDGDADRSDVVNAPFGLFPRPLPPGRQRSGSTSIAKHFRLLGRVVAKALQDCRLLDLPLSPVLYRLVLGRKVDLYTLRAADPALSASLERLDAAERASAASGTPATVDGCSLEDLCLTFVLPGSPNYPLCPNGGDVAVTSANLRTYIDAVVDAVLGSGVTSQVDAFRAGFNAIFPLSSLEPFFEDEIEAMLCGTGEAWTSEGLSAVIKFDHGYTATSEPIKALLEVLSELDAVDQRRFLRFVTGTPRLPPGGVASLQPRLTVVRKLSVASATAMGAGGEGSFGTSAPTGGGGGFSAASDGGGGGMFRNPVDGDLPSVMTCANYLKLPPYSSKDVLRERVLFAIREGQGSFDLS